MSMLIRPLAMVAWLAALPLPAAAQDAGVPGPEATCFPACRVGFVCHQGQCVSACNPACAPHEVCNAAGECVSACNPPCAAGELCTHGECVTVGAPNVDVPPPAVPPEPPSAASPPPPANPPALAHPPAEPAPNAFPQRLTARPMTLP